MSKMKNGILPCSKQSLYEDVNIHEPSSLKEQQKLSQLYELPHYNQNKKSTLTSSISPSICTFAFINKDNKLQINPQAIDFISLYSHFDIVYCGVYGSRKSGKSTFIDSVLNIDPSKQTGFAAQGKYDNKQSLKIHKNPLQVGQSKRIFFIQYSKAYETSQITEPQQKLLDLLLFASNSMILMISKQGTLNIITKHIEKSAERLKFNLKNINFWPQNAYIVNTYNTISKNIGSIDSYFSRISLILWMKGQTKPLANLMKDISSCNNTKSFRRISNNFHITRKVLFKLEQQQNIVKQSNLNIEGIFQSIYQQLSSQYLLYHYQLYDDTLQQYFADEKPYSVDYLIDSFQKSRNIVLSHFKENHINKESTEVQIQKLQAYIDQRQRLIIEVNKKKSRFQIHHFISSIEHFKDIHKQTQIINLIQQFRQLSRTYQHSGVEEYAEALHQIINNIQKNSRKAKKRQMQQMSNYAKQLQQQIIHTKEQLSKVRQAGKASKNRKQEFQSFLKKQQQVKDKITKTTRQIEQQKKSNKLIFNTKLSSQQKIDKMLQTIRDLQEVVRQNNNKKQQIQKQYDFNPQIERLTRKLQRLQRQMNGEGSKLQSMLNAQPVQSKLSGYTNNKRSK